jgi:hypothetical protein
LAAEESGEHRCGPARRNCPVKVARTPPTVVNMLTGSGRTRKCLRAPVDYYSIHPHVQGGHAHALISLFTFSDKSFRHKYATR